MRRILFLTGTRADFGKLKPLIAAVSEAPEFEAHIFVTGMHMFERFGSTWEEVADARLADFTTFLNQELGDPMDRVMARTVDGLSGLVREYSPDLLVVHGDRVETLAGASVGILNNIRVAHIEGGELSGTVDEALRHAISKLSHWHFVANDCARKNLLQLGEKDSSVFVIGSPDIDVMESGTLPSITEAKNHYGIDWKSYAILLLHPVTTEQGRAGESARQVLDALKTAGRHVIVVEPNNDPGSEEIRDVYEQYRVYPQFKFFPSMRFEYFLALMRESDFLIGNSSAGIREAPHMAVPSINIGSRQKDRAVSKMIIDSEPHLEKILHAIRHTDEIPRKPDQNFGDGNSAQRFMSHLSSQEFWDAPIQKQFVPRKIDEGDSA